MQQLSKEGYWTHREQDQTQGAQTTDRRLFQKVTKTSTLENNQSTVCWALSPLVKTTEAKTSKRLTQEVAAMIFIFQNNNIKYMRFIIFAVLLGLSV